MLVEQQGGQCRGVNAVRLFTWNLRHQFGVQGVNAFHHQYLVVVQPQFTSAHLALARLEVIAWQLHLLTPEEGVHLLVEQRQVQGMQVFEVIFAFLVARRLFPVQEVVVE